MFLSRRAVRLASLKLDPAACMLCQWRTFSTSYRQFEEKGSQEKPAVPKRLVPEALKNAPRSHGKSVDKFTPKPLDRPIGLPNPPRRGENTGLDSRTLKQRRDDFVDYDKHIARRKKLTQQISKPYYREWSNMRLHKGKSFLAPPSIFKAEPSLYFPNFFGQTLRKDKGYRDTTEVLEGKITVVSLYSSVWAENQAKTFASQTENPELHKIIDARDGVAQFVEINIEDVYLKHLMIRMFMYRLRKQRTPEAWNRYFLVKQNVSIEDADSIGFLNGKVGYTYLVDDNCKIRWAGSGMAEGDEKEGLVKGVKRLIDDFQNKKKAPIAVAPENVLGKPALLQKVAQRS